MTAGFVLAAWEHLRDGWVDPTTCLVAMGYAGWRHHKISPTKKFISRETGADVLNGTAIFPLLLLTLSVFSRYLAAELMLTNKVILFAAGVVALLAVLEDSDPPAGEG